MVREANPPADPKPPYPEAKRAVQRSLVATILGVVFLGAGISKQISRDWWIETFTGIGAPAWFLHAVGLVEMVAAVLVLIPATRVLGAGLISVVMIGAVITHLLAGQFLAALIPLTMLVLAGLLLGPLRSAVKYEPGPQAGTTPPDQSPQAGQPRPTV